MLETKLRFADFVIDLLKKQAGFGKREVEKILSKILRFMSETEEKTKLCVARFGKNLLLRECADWFGSFTGEELIKVNFL